MSEQDIWLRQAWKEIMGTGQVGKRFKSLPLFRTWAIENGFREGSVVARRDQNGLFCEENCVVVLSDDDAAEEEANNELERDIAGWDRVADSIRKQFGLPPIMTGSPCPGCPEENTCEKTDCVCETRLRSWDAMTQRIKDKANARR